MKLKPCSVCGTPVTVCCSHGLEDGRTLLSLGCRECGKTVGTILRPGEVETDALQRLAVLWNQKKQSRLEVLIADVNMGEILSHIEDGTLKGWLDKWHEEVKNELKKRK